MTKENEEKHVSYVYLVNTEMGELLYDQDLDYLTGEQYDPVAIFSFQQEALAPAEDWEDMKLSYTDEMVVDRVRQLLRSKIKKIARDLELH